MSLKKCKECGNQVSTKADKCPNCGVKNPAKKTISKFWIGVINISILIFFWHLFTQGDNIEINPEADRFSVLSLNLREGPTTSFDIINSLNSGEFVKVLDDSLGWYLVETIERDNNIVGWGSGTFLKHVSEHENWVAENEKKEEQEPAPREPTRKEIIEDGFSAWDGSHIELVKEIKKLMNDPSSFEHVETRYNDQGSRLYVVMQFRGTNAFGGVVTQTATAYCDLDGNVEELISIQ